MDPRQFRQWSPPIVAGANVSPGTIISKAISPESNYDWDPKRQQFRSKKVLEMEGQGKKPPPIKGTPKKEGKGKAPPKKKDLPKHDGYTATTVATGPVQHVGANASSVDRMKKEEGKKAEAAVPKKKASPKKEEGKTLTLVAEADSKGKTTVKKIEPKKPKAAASPIKPIEVEVKQEPKQLPPKGATSKEPKVTKPKAPKVAPVKSPQEASVAKPIGSTGGPRPIGLAPGMSSSTGGPQLTGQAMPRVSPAQQTSKGFSNFDELEAMSKAKFKAGSGQVGKRKAGSDKVTRAAKAPPKAAPKPLGQMEGRAPASPALKPGVGKKLGTASTGNDRVKMGKIESKTKPSAGPKVEAIRPGQATPSSESKRMGVSLQGSSGGPKPIGAETPAAAGAANTPGATVTPQGMSTTAGGYKTSGTGGGQFSWNPGQNKKPSEVPAVASPTASPAAPTVAAKPEAAPAATPASPAGGGVPQASPEKTPGGKPKAGPMTTTGGPQLGGKQSPIGSAAGIGYAEGSFIGAETGGSKTGGTAGVNVAATEAVGALSGGGSSGGAKPSRQTFTQTGYMPTRSPFTGRGGMGGGTAIQSGPGQKPTQSSMKASLTALKSFMSSPRGIPGSRRLPGGE